MECGPLTNEEREELEAIMYEDEVCEIAERIKEGLYEVEEEGEYRFSEMVGEDVQKGICTGEKKSIQIDEDLSQRMVIIFIQ